MSEQLIQFPSHALALPSPVVNGQQPSGVRALKRKRTRSKTHLGLTATRRGIVSELLSIADLVPASTMIVCARVRDILRGSKPWDLPDEEVTAFLIEHPESIEEISHA